MLLDFGFLPLPSIPVRLKNSYLNEKKNTSYTLLGPTCVLISEKSTTYMVVWLYTIIWQVRVCI